MEKKAAGRKVNFTVWVEPEEAERIRRHVEGLEFPVAVTAWMRTVILRALEDAAPKKKR